VDEAALLAGLGILQIVFRVFLQVDAHAADAAPSEVEKDSTKPYQPPKVLLTFPTNWLKERLSAKLML
jgi:hypothetical protein